MDAQLSKMELTFWWFGGVVMACEQTWAISDARAMGIESNLAGKGASLTRVVSKGLHSRLSTHRAQDPNASPFHLCPGLSLCLG